MSNNENIRERIERAINVDRGYFQKCLDQRNPGPNAAGSVFSAAQSVDSVLEAANEAIPATDDPNIKTPAVGFRLPISGKLGIIDLNSLDINTPVKLIDPKGTGKVNASIPGSLSQDCHYTTILLGPGQGENAPEQVWTLFPGPSIAPSEVDAQDRANTTITVQEALALGLTSAKVVS